MELTEIVKLWEVVQVFQRYTAFQKLALIIGTPVALYVGYLLTIGRPPLVLHELHFVLLQDRQVQQLEDGSKAIEIEFRLLNSTSPPAEIHNVFGQIWIDGTYFIGSTLPPARGRSGRPRVEWDIQMAVFPKESVFIPPKIAARMPAPGEELRVGAQFVSKETSKLEYFWKLVNEDGIPKIVFVKNPHNFK